MPTDLRVLIVEDSEDDADLLLHELKRGGYNPIFERVDSRKQMVGALETKEWDLILSDFAMPGFSGHAALDIWKEKELDIPFIVISGTIGEETAVVMMKAGVSDYLMKQNLTRLNAAIDRELREASMRRERKQAEQFLRDSELRFSLFMNNFPGLVFIEDTLGQMVYVNQQFKDLLPGKDLIGQSPRDFLPSDWAALLSEGDERARAGELVSVTREVQTAKGERWFEMTKFLIPRQNTNALIGVFALDVSERVRAEKEVIAAKDSLEKAYDETLEGWARALEYHEVETLNHSRNVVGKTVELAREMGITDDEEIKHIRRGALLHDIGKMGIPISILRKPGPLDPDEWKIIKQHPLIAYNLLSPIEFLRPAMDIPYSHHERWDGTGYPRLLEGDEIPLKARIFAVVDVYYALRENRPYSSEWPPKTALDYIRRESGSHFDPDVVDAFVRLISREKT
jgi:PAS domain S-box-containing protein/putative nucleotidyltransferase with HDIG domain